MSIRTVATIGWLCLVIDTALAASFFVSKGGDAAGRGMATGIGVVVTPIVAVVAGGLYWAQRSGSFAGVIAATIVAAIPFYLLAKNVSSVPVRMIERSIQRAGLGKFADQRLTDMATAIGARDTARLATLARQGGFDWSARDRKGRTIFGIAVEEARQATSDDQQLAQLRILVDAGARYQDDALGERTRIFSDLVQNTGDQHLAMIALLLDAGANPNDTESDGRPLLLDYRMTANKAKLFIEHGADFKGIRDTRDDRPGWDVLMNAAYTRNWALAIYYLEQGCDPRFKAKDGKTVRDVVELVKEEERGLGGDAFGGLYRRFTDVLDAKLAAPPVS
jgi:hypothetical protein